MGPCYPLRLDLEEPMTTRRYCPSCLDVTDAALCPRHGISTFPEDTYPNLGHDPLIGAEVGGRFRVEALIGQGGMGRVYRALQLSMDRPVALKVLRTRYAGDERRLARFRREARATSLLSHPNTVRILDSGETSDGNPYLVTELLEGRPLDRVLEDEPRLPADRAVRIASQVLRSLAEAHRNAVVHRDVKASNIFLCEVDGDKDFVKLLDFGVARFVDGSEDAHRITRTGFVVGTPSYMSPEQAQGLPVDARSDLYSVGVLLYEMLSGRLPFTGVSPLALRLAHAVDAPPPIGVEGDGVSRPLGLVVMTCLAKLPGDRPQSAEALRLALQGALQSGPAAGSEPPLAATAPMLPAIEPTTEPLSDTIVGGTSGEDTADWAPSPTAPRGPARPSR